MKKLLPIFLLLASNVTYSANIKNNTYILGLVGQKAVEVEDVSASYNSPTKIYYYSKTPSTGFELQLNKETIEVAWLFVRREKLEENKKAEQMAIGFTEKLLGKQSMELLIKPMKSGQSIQSIKISGVTITGARCGSTQCMYSVIR